MAEPDYDAIARQHGGKAVDADPGMLETGGQMAKDFLGGIGSGVFSTARGALNLLSLAGRNPGGFQSEMLDRLATPPQSTAGQAGHFVEQAGEFMLPGMATRGIAGGANALVRIPAQMAAEGAGAGLVSGVQTGGDLQAMRNAASLGAAVPVIGAGLTATAPRLREAAVTQFSRVLNPTKEKTKAITEKIVPEMIRRGEWAASLPRLLNKAQDRMRFFGQQIDDVWDKMTATGTTAQVDPILQRLDDVAKEHFYVTNAQGQLVPLRGPAEAGLNELQGIGETLLEASTVNPVNGTREIPAATLRSLRQYWDEVADKSGAFTKNQGQLADWARGRASKYAGDAVRAELASASPDLAALNKEFSFWSRVADVTEATVARRTGQQKPLARRLMQGAGAVAGATIGGQAGGPAGGTIGALLGGPGMDLMQAVVSSPAWGMVSAITKDRLSQALTNGNRGQALFYLGQAARAAGLEQATRPGVSESQSLKSRR